MLYSCVKEVALKTLCKSFTYRCIKIIYPEKLSQKGVEIDDEKMSAFNT